MGDTTTPARRKNGRPTKYNWRTVKRVIRCLQKGMPVTLAASAAGITFQSLCTYRTAHPNFDAAVKKAIARGVEKRLEKIEKASEAGDWRAAAWMLEHCQPEHFAKNRIEVTGADGAALTVGVGIYLPKKDGAPSVEVNAVVKKEIEND